MSYALNQILNTHWAITEEYLRMMISIAERQPDFELLEKIRSEKPKEAGTASIRSGVAVIPVRGPLFKRANLLTEHCGATSYETVLRDFHQMLISDRVQSIVFGIDSPGGEANGCSELADHIHAARGQKPIAAYVGGTGASAAYWIAGACDKVFASDSAILGSIGVQSVVQSDRRDGEIRFVSSQSPNKNRDPSTEEGAQEVQTVIDGLADVFVSKVARNRGVSVNHVMENYGQGSVFVGSAAKKRGLIDEISTLEDVISHHGEKKLTTEPMTAAFIAEKHPEIAQFFMKEGEKAALERISVEEQRKSRICILAKGQVSDEFLSDLLSRDVSIQDAALEILIEAQRRPNLASRQAIETVLQDLNIPPLPEKDREISQKKTLDQQLEAALQISQKIDGIKVRGLA